MTIGSTFHLRLLTPDQTLVDAQATAVVVPGAEGEFTVLPGHMALISALKTGQIKVHVQGTHEQIFSVSGGFADVGNTHCTILAEGLLAA